MSRQGLLPGFPDGAARVSQSSLRILEKEGQVTYFVDGDNFFSHKTGDQASRAFVLAMLMDNGHVRPCELEDPPLCIPHRTLMNWREKLRKDGPDSFFRPKRHRGAPVMTAEMIVECERLLAGTTNVSSIARSLGIDDSTLRKAIKHGAVTKPLGTAGSHVSDVTTTKADRSRADAEAASGMGTACTRADERMAAAMSLAECATARFEPARDVTMGGLLTGLPALCANGLLSGIGSHLKLASGFYSCLHILLTLGFMALGRIRRPEGLRHVPPGELGKSIGLDRVPEARTLRAKITEMATTGKPDVWMMELAKTWMGDDPDEAGYLYVDGHVRVYQGNKAHLPRRYVSRERLCLRGTTDYWVNDALGRPFFVVSKAVTEGLAETLLKDIVPELLNTVPGQPTQAELEADPLLHRFVIIFDREGATHSLIAALWKKRIGAITYRKNVKDSWPESDFSERTVLVPGGGNTKMELANRETTLDSGEASIPVIEIRRLTETGHQTAVICSARSLGAIIVAGRMFSRWCQENFFAYMMKHYDIDGLVEYGADPLPGTLLIVNPAWRNLNKAVHKSHSAVKKLQAKFGAESALMDGADVQEKADCLRELQIAEAELNRLREKRHKTPRKVKLDSLPEDQRPTQLKPLNKQLTDTVKMIAYRAETALVAILRRHLNKEDEARALVRELLVSSADIEPDNRAKTLTIKIHRMSCPAHDKAIAALLEELSQQDFSHPETGAKMIFTLV